MLYGRFHFSRYASWPPSWQARGGTIEDVGRSAFVLGLPAAVLLGTAIVGRAGTWLRTAVRQPGASLPPPPTMLVDVAVAGYLAFIVAFALAYRDFSFMKDIFVLPAVLAFAALFAQALSTLGQSTRGRAAARLVIAATVLLAVAYVIDVAALAWQLVPRTLSAPSRGRSDASAVRESGPPRVAQEGDGTDDGFAWRRSRSPRFARAMPCAAGSAS